MQKKALLFAALRQLGVPASHLKSENSAAVSHITTLPYNYRLSTNKIHDGSN